MKTALSAGINRAYKKWFNKFLWGFLVLILGVFFLKTLAISANAEVLRDTQSPILFDSSDDEYIYPTEYYIHGCPEPQQPDEAQCFIDIVTDSSGNIKTFASPDDYIPFAQQELAGQSQQPVQASNLDTKSILRLHNAYNLPCTPKGQVDDHCDAPKNKNGKVDYSGQPVVAVVIAYNNPYIEQDLLKYDSQYGLKSHCKKSNGCLTIMNQRGNTAISSLPIKPPNTSKLHETRWYEESSIDIQTLHAICQTCKILVVEADNAGLPNMAAAVNTAAKQKKVIAISNSYGGKDSTKFTPDTYKAYNHPGIAVVAAAGDFGYGSFFPAASPSVVSVGGTKLALKNLKDKNGNIIKRNVYSGEGIMYGTESGCSVWANANPWQSRLANYALTNCNGKKSLVDVAADGDSSSGVMVYSSYDKGWILGSGTSLSAPIIAATFGLADNIGKGVNASSIPYAHRSGLNDVKYGSNGNCTVALCTSITGFDGPTGLGSPNGTTAFGGNVAPVNVGTPSIPYEKIQVAGRSLNPPVQSYFQSASVNYVASSSGTPPITTTNTYQGRKIAFIPNKSFYLQSNIFTKNGITALDILNNGDVIGGGYNGFFIKSASDKSWTNLQFANIPSSFNAPPVTFQKIVQTNDGTKTYLMGDNGLFMLDNSNQTIFEFMDPYIKNGHLSGLKDIVAYGPNGAVVYRDDPINSGYQAIYYITDYAVYSWDTPYKYVGFKQTMPDSIQGLFVDNTTSTPTLYANVKHCLYSPCTPINSLYKISFNTNNGDNSDGVVGYIRGRIIGNNMNLFDLSVNPRTDSTSLDVLYGNHGSYTSGSANLGAITNFDAGAPYLEFQNTSYLPSGKASVSQFVMAKNGNTPELWGVSTGDNAGIEYSNNINTGNLPSFQYLDASNSNKLANSSPISVATDGTNTIMVGHQYINGGNNALITLLQINLNVSNMNLDTSQTSSSSSAANNSQINLVTPQTTPSATPSVTSSPTPSVSPTLTPMLTPLIPSGKSNLPLPL